MAATATKKEAAPDIDFSMDAGAGLEKVTINDLAKPFLVILQKMSPEVDDSNGKFIRGAKPGMIMNTVTKEMYDGKEGIYFIPTGFVPMDVEWKTREKGGGLVAMHEVPKPGEAPTYGPTTKNDRGQDVTARGTIVVRTAYHYGKYKDAAGTTQFAVIAMASTQLKKSKNWLSKIASIRMKTGDGREFTPGMYAHQWKLRTVVESNDKGSWYGWSIESGGRLSDLNLYNECKENNKLVMSGQLLLTNTPDDHPEAAAADVKEY
jgi:hypothetical protein